MILKRSLNSIAGRAMVEVISRRLLTAEARVLAWFSLCGICGGQSGTRTVFSPRSSLSSVNTIPPWLSTLIYPMGLDNRLVTGCSSAT
jgi:hypothetical protein